MAHRHERREAMHPSARAKQFPSASSTPIPLTYDFLQVPQSLPAQHNLMHEEAGQTLVSFRDLQKWHLQCFWQQQMFDLKNLTDHKQHQLPLARIKRIMKIEGDAKMVSSDTPIFFAKACEFFISELTLRSWLHAERCKRHTIRRTDVAGAICHENTLNFLMDILHPEEMQVYMRQPLVLQHQIMPQEQPSPDNYSMRNNHFFEYAGPRCNLANQLQEQSMKDVVK